MTGLGTSTVCGIVSDVTKAIINNLWNEQVDQHFPKDKQQFREKILDMEEMWQFSCSWGLLMVPYSSEMPAWWSSSQ